MKLPEVITRGPRNLRRWLNDLRLFVKANRILHEGAPGWNASPEGITPPPWTPPGAEGDKSCCGIGSLYCSTELNAAFVRPEGAADFVEVSETQWAGMILTEGKDGVWTGINGNQEWRGSAPGIEGVTFNATAGTPSVEAFTLKPLPETLSASSGAQEERLSLVIGQGRLEYQGDTWVLFWDPWGSQTGSEDGEWNLANLWLREGGACNPVGEYKDFGDGLAHVGAAGAVGGEKDHVQFQGADRTLEGSSAFKIVRLEPTP